MKMKKKHIRFPKRLNFNNGKVEMSHGSGGRAMSQLIEELFQDAFTNSYLRKNNDQAVLPVDKGKIAFTTDSFVINPLFFPGGNIGSLAVHGTINDLSMSARTDAKGRGPCECCSKCLVGRVPQC